MISTAACLLIVAAALALRFLGIRNGLPYLYDVDEPDFVSLSVHMLHANHLNPGWWGHPGSTLLYMLEALYGVIYVAGHKLGAFATPSEYQALYLSDPTVFYISGRILCVLFGAASIVLLYAIGRRLLSRPAALFATALLAVTPLHVNFSRILRTDIIATFCVLAAFWFVLQALRERDAMRWYIAAGFAVGLATATKYPAVLFLIVIAWAAWGMPATVMTRVKHMVAAGLAAAGGVIVGSPLLLPNFRTVLQNVLYENRSDDVGLGGHGFLGNLAAYTFQTLPQTLSWPGWVLLVIGTILCFASRRRDLRLVPIFPIALVVFVSALHLFRDSWLIPALPFCALAAAYGAEGCMAWLSRRWRPALARPLVLVAAAYPLVALGTADVVHGQELAGINTRTQAANWITTHVPPHSRILEEQNGPQLPSALYTHFVVSKAGAITPAPAPSLRFANFRPNMDWSSAPIGALADVAQIRQANIQYVVISDRNFYVSHAASYERIASGYRNVAQLGERIYRVAPTAGVNTGPVIEVYREPAAPKP